MTLKMAELAPADRQGGDGHDGEQGRFGQTAENALSSQVKNTAERR